MCVHLKYWCYVCSEHLVVALQYQVLAPFPHPVPGAYFVYGGQGREEEVAEVEMEEEEVAEER
jgi:hypothetical protein